MSRALEIFTFQENATTPQDGKECFINQAQEITFEISGVTSASQVIFEGKINGNFYPISCVKLDDLSMANSSTNINELWQASVTSLSSFRVRVVSIIDGYINVIGKVAG